MENNYQRYADSFYLNSHYHFNDNNLSIYRLTMKKLQLFVFIIIFSINVNSQNNYFRFISFSTEKGLAHNTVYDILQDKRGFLWFATENGLSMYDGFNFTTFLNDPDNNNTLSHNLTFKLTEDHQGNIWIATQGGGLNKFDIITEQFSSIKSFSIGSEFFDMHILSGITLTPEGNLLLSLQNKGVFLYNPVKKKFSKIFIPELNNNTSISIGSSYIDKKGNFWIPTNGAGLIYINNQQTFSKIFKNDPENNNSISNDVVTSVREDFEGNIWIGTIDGLNKLEVKKNIITRFSRNDNLSDNAISNVFEDSERNLWILTFTNGVNIFDRKKKNFINIKKNPNDINSISANMTISIYEDNTKGIWIGTFGGGVNRFDKTKNAFANYVFNPDEPNGISKGIVWNFFEDSNGHLWICTENATNILNRTTGKITKLDFYDQLKFKAVFTTIVQDKNQLFWIGTDKGLFSYNHVTKQIMNRNGEIQKLLELKNVFIRTSYLDSNKDLWIGTGSGLILYDTDKQRFRRFKFLNSGNSAQGGENDIRAIYEDERGRTWVGTWTGFFLINKEKSTYEIFSSQKPDILAMGNNSIRSFYQQKKHPDILWIATNNGLVKFNTSNLSIKQYSRKHGLSDPSILKILEDNNMKLWISSNNGIFKFDPEKEQFTQYTMADGLTHNESRIAAFYKLKGGEFLFGTINGFSLFNPDSLRINTIKPIILFSNFYLANEKVVVGDVFNNSQILSKSFSLTDKIELLYNQNIFSIEFSLSDYTGSAKIQFLYKLENFDKEWHLADNKIRKVTFTNLDPGEYVFKVRGMSGDGIWSEIKELKIHIIPPFYKTNLFIILVVIVIIIFLYMIVRQRIARINKRNKELSKWNNELKLEIENKIKAQKEKERLNKILIEKNEELEQLLYISSHDLRTPLVNVSAYSKELEYNLENLFNSADCKISLQKLSPQLDKLVKEDIPESLTFIRQNVYKMDFLLKGLVEYSRIGRGGLVIKTIDMNKLVKTITDIELKIYIEKFGKEINLKINDLPELDADYNKIHFMFYQIINNSFRYLDKNRNGELVISGYSDDNFNYYKIWDNGIGIEESQFDKIFDVYYRIDPDISEGIGIGLSISQKLAKMHEGKIEVHSKKGEWTEFIVKIPKNISNILPDGKTS